MPAVRFSDTPPPTADLVVIGGGVIGCATAFFAARAGLRVVVLERRAALGTLTTPVSTGAFRLQFDNAEEIAMVGEGVELFDAFAERTGLDGTTFRMLKFRSMYTDAEERKAELMASNDAKGGVLFFMANDPRVTTPGRWMRKYSLDELPQFLNVLKG